MKLSRLAGFYVPVVTIFGYVFLFAPLVVLIVYSFNAGRSTVVWAGFSMDWYAQALNDRGLQRGLPGQCDCRGALCSHQHSNRDKRCACRHQAILSREEPFSTILIAPLVLPEIVLAVGLLVTTVWSGITLGYVTLVAGHVLVSVPFAFLIVRAAAAGLDPRLDEAAADLGANGAQTFMRVTLPLLMPAILSATLLSSVISFDNFVMSTFVSGVGTTPLPIQIYSMLKTGLTPKINALGTMLIAINVLAILLVMGRYLKTIRGTG